jgi:hypothetical protein
MRSLHILENKCRFHCRVVEFRPQCVELSCQPTFLFLVCFRQRGHICVVRSERLESPRLVNAALLLDVAFQLLDRVLQLIEARLRNEEELLLRDVAA